MIELALHPPLRDRRRPRNTVPGTVSDHRGRAGLGHGNPAGLGRFDTAANALENPLPAGPPRAGATRSITPSARPATAAGAGDGPVGKRMGAPSLLTDRAKAYRDGYLYSIIRYGRGVMPQYGDKIFRSGASAGRS